ncbi:hypothetical protein SKAU_G00346680 [Synaphobranchus kaupii]|uniref:Uncharacterized protein n=1 Tax=Synaphobranchus kaupii TaxID=118154 RepID=A0A9Q1IGT6_SYNKA|nr:hypothetical protein SKAU_G00346680 [Synaphobranchus kaupii]
MRMISAERSAQDVACSRSGLPQGAIDNPKRPYPDSPRAAARSPVLLRRDGALR